MATFSRKVDVTWNGGLMDGKGEARAGTGAFTLPVTFPVRVGEPEGHTSPEELIAAAHAACYAMAFNATLGRNNAKAATTHVTATVTADKGESGIKVVSSVLDVTVTGLEGADASALQALAQKAEAGCPISNALRNNVHITVNARIAQGA
ncbi:MAG TPA: OsmC family peroxiredoxin [Vicinamibacterales bacterium]